MSDGCRENVSRYIPFCESYGRFASEIVVVIGGANMWIFIRGTCITTLVDDLDRPS